MNRMAHERELKAYKLKWPGFRELGLGALFREYFFTSLVLGSGLGWVRVRVRFCGINTVGAE